MKVNTFEDGERKTHTAVEIQSLILKLEALEEAIENQSNDWQITILEIRTALQKLGD